MACITFSKFLKITRLVVCLEDRSSIHCLFLDFAKASESVPFERLAYSSQQWYRDAPLFPPSLCQISRQSDMAFAFYSSFCKCEKRQKNKKKMKKLSQFLKSHISGTLEASLPNLVCAVLKLEGVSTAKIVLFHQGITELQRCDNCVFFLPVNILTGVVRRLLGPHDTLPCVLILYKYCTNK